ncbi:MAG: TetR/AcrR family transcriptional regulator [Clostridia bacterium]|nr:TetR/AcrR family transcriptional regulator [Clostridia bacterium]
MDRRQRKTRESIFKAFIDLLSKKDYNKITVSEIIDSADIGRSTFYSNFETKDYLLKELCEDLFCHIFDSENKNHANHNHIFSCDAPDSVFLHLLMHLQKNDNNLLVLFKCYNNEVFLKYFKANLKKLVEKHPDMFKTNKIKNLPESFRVNHIVSTFAETVKWWIDNGTKESPEKISEYFFSIV